MPSSRAIVVLGMHRNGTSLLTRGLQSLGVYLGHDFYATRPDNPTGYWEDRIIQDLNDRILGAFGLEWQSVDLISDEQWRDTDLEAFRREAADHLRVHFLDHPIWGFKDPRTILLLRFWRPLFQEFGVDDRYIVAVRNPLSVAGSLRLRQGMPAAQAHLLWLLHMVPHLQRTADRPFVVVDYDQVMADPPGQLARVAERLEIPVSQKHREEIAEFAREFVRLGLRHHNFSPDDFEMIPRIAPASREAYLRLTQLASDNFTTDSDRFWIPWKRLSETTVALVAEAAAQNDVATRQRRLQRKAAVTFRFTERPIFTDVKVFIVTGFQRTGTNLLREVLNTNQGVAMVAEILTPCPLPGHKTPGPPLPKQSDEDTVQSYQYPIGTDIAEVNPGLNYGGHWGNFLRTLPAGAYPAGTPSEAEALLDRYFSFLLNLIHRQWALGDKSQVHAIGLDIKYSHLNRLAPPGWGKSSRPFLLNYFQARGVTIIHMARRNVIQCVISGLVMERTGVCHNYEGKTMEESFVITPAQCLNRAREMVSKREEFLKLIGGFKVVDCEYDELTLEIARADVLTGTIPDEPGPLRDIATALGVPFQFAYNGILQKTVNVSYERLLSNREELVRAVGESEFREFASTLI